MHAIPASSVTSGDGPSCGLHDGGRPGGGRRGAGQHGASEHGASKHGGSRLEALILMGAIGVCTAATIAGGGYGSYPVLDIVVGVVSVALLPLVRRWPLHVGLVLSLLAAVSPAATPSATTAALIIARYRRLGMALAVGATGIAAHLIRETWRPIHGLPYAWWAVLVFVAYAAIVGWGTLIRANRALITSLRDRAEQAEANQARRVTEARAAERTRIAREMHDVLAHRLSLLATYAGALAYRPDAPPEQVSRAAEVVRSGVHEALDELREVIGVLRDDSLPDLAAASRPLPALADLPELVEESRAAGMRIETGGDAWPARSAGVPGLPDVAGRTAYRVVQEGLTNARKHAPGQPVTVALDGRPGTGLDVTVANPTGSAPASPHSVSTGGPSFLVPGSGTGLIGLTERLELAGGTLVWHNAGGEFRLRAWLPWPEAADPDPTGPGATLPDTSVLDVPGAGEILAGPASAEQNV